MNNEALPGKNIGKGMLIITWIIGLVGLTLAFGSWEDKQYNPNSNVDSLNGENSRTVVLKRNRFGHYVATGEINGTSVVFLVDTGASDVSVPVNIARKLKLKPGPKHTAITANGKVQVSSTELDSLTLGAIKLNRVRASINPGMSGNEILLGMSALKSLDFAQSGDELTLTQYSY